MSHFSVIAFIDRDYADLETLMEQYDCQSENPEYLEYDEFWNLEQAKKEFKEDVADIKRWREDIDRWRKMKQMSLEEYMLNHHGMVKNVEDGEITYGYMQNNNGMYDWYVIGGRWQGSLIDKNGNKVNGGDMQDIDWKATRDEITRYIENTYDNYLENQNGWSDIREGETKEEYVKRKDKGMTTHFWNLLSADEWVQTEGEDGNRIIDEWIEEFKDRENIEVYIIDCHI